MRKITRLKMCERYANYALPPPRTTRQQGRAFLVVSTVEAQGEAQVTDLPPKMPFTFLSVAHHSRIHHVQPIVSQPLDAKDFQPGLANRFAQYFSSLPLKTWRMITLACSCLRLCRRVLTNSLSEESRRQLPDNPQCHIRVHDTLSLFQYILLHHITHVQLSLS